jgi:2-methylcitrate dehydratase PrpD
MNKNITDIFIDDIHNLANVRLSEQIVPLAKRCLLDYLGCSFAGAALLQKKGNKLLDDLGSPEDGVLVIGFNRKAGIIDAALMNGMSAHVAELDDGIRFGMIHPGAPVISALLPLFQRERLSGRNLLTGIVAGYEAAVRVAMAIQPSHKSRGFHATGTCGTIGAALGVAAALGFTKSQMKQTLSAAATRASGILKAIRDDSELKPYNAGQAAAGGLSAAFFGRAGFLGPDDVFTGEGGFFSALAETTDLSFLQKKKGTPLEIEKVYVKPYAACRHCHPAIDAALHLRADNTLIPGKIQSINVSTYHLGVSGHEHVQIDGVASAKMSTPYSVAVALYTGGAGIEAFQMEKISDTDILALARKVTVYPDDALSAVVPQKRPAVVEITTYESKVYMKRVDLAKGEPETPLSLKEVSEKFISLAVFARRTEKHINRIIHHVRHLETDLHKLLVLL